MYGERFEEMEERFEKKWEETMDEVVKVDKKVNGTICWLNGLSTSMDGLSRSMDSIYDAVRKTDIKVYALFVVSSVSFLHVE